MNVTLNAFDVLALLPSLDAVARQPLTGDDRLAIARTLRMLRTFVSAWDSERLEVAESFANHDAAGTAQIETIETPAGTVSRFVTTPANVLARDKELQQIGTAMTIAVHPLIPAQLKQATAEQLASLGALITWPAEESPDGEA